MTNCFLIPYDRGEGTRFILFSDEALLKANVHDYEIALARDPAGYVANFKEKTLITVKLYLRFSSYYVTLIREGVINGNT
ncbi:hypothetical protein [Evansella cellulosilytica]|uniref:Uncharacterized protein n=1 Tax=Evansella cellulosilytica (strain ATCC 21833 / DSM 2522 / FERM P-1141 / JCM 9156 / N-4) TaxID=649639 RepID=E6TY68_EVAC2|nr:hypothetical protein [Evansella cellulosilytica]ADU32387.1 hypothetical protein Bcell_4160 [Evansella cellulosilytica DSM 2522]